MRKVLFVSLVALAAVVRVPAASAWTWPVDGPVLRPFALGDNVYAGGQHRGIDIGAVAGAPVRAPAGGQVTFAGSVPRYGKTLTIRTADGYAVTLLHLGSLLLTRGATVTEGETVAGVGADGDAQHTEPYVYLGIRHWADEHGYVDPLLFLPPASSSASEAAPAPPEVGAQAPGAAAPQASPPVVAQPPLVATPPSPPLPSVDSTEPHASPDAGAQAQSDAAAELPADVTVAAVQIRRPHQLANVPRVTGPRRELLQAPTAPRSQIPAHEMRAAVPVAGGHVHQGSARATPLRASPIRIVERPSPSTRPTALTAATHAERWDPAVAGQPRPRPDGPAGSSPYGHRQHTLLLLGLLGVALLGGLARRQLKSPATPRLPSQRYVRCPLGRRMPSAAVSVAACGRVGPPLRPSHRCGRPARVLAPSARPRRPRRPAVAGRPS